jgi:hypothetical protein
MIEFKPFPKIPRLTRECVITEKIDGTNACIYITEDGTVQAGSRSRWITPQDDNFGFARWCEAHHDELLNLGPGTHWGEWWGQGIQRGYGLKEKYFSLFNVRRWTDEEPAPTCCRIVPVLYRGLFDTGVIDKVLTSLELSGSWASSGFMHPEGIVVYHIAGNLMFKKTLDKDAEPKSKKRGEDDSTNQSANDAIAAREEVSANG